MIRKMTQEIEDKRNKYQREWQHFNDRQEVTNGMEELKRTIEVNKPKRRVDMKGRRTGTRSSKLKHEKSDARTGTSKTQGRSTEANDRNETKGRK